MDNIYWLLPYLDNLSFTRISVRFTPISDLAQKAWIGAAVRNRFLQAAEKVMLSEGMTLREKLDTLPLSEDHFLYNQFKGGFPKGYMFDVSRLSSAKSSFELKADETYRLDLLLIGTMNSLQPQMITALQTMLSDGLGNPPVQLMLQEMKIEKSVSLRNFAKRNFEGPVTGEFRLRTPLSLLKPLKNTSHVSYQAKMNGFPSFYQWMNAAVNRLMASTLLYSEGHLSVIDTREEWERSIENFVFPAADAWLMEAGLRFRKLRSTPKQGEVNVYVMSGYVGNMTYSGISPFHVPVVGLMSQLGVGNDINFGLGIYDVDFTEI